MLEDGGANEDDIIAARCKYRGTSAEYARFSKAMNLKQQRDRVTVDGLGNIGVGKWKDKADKAKAPFPKGFKDRRTLKEKISTEDLENFKIAAEKLNIQLGSSPNDVYGGFENYRGDKQILKDVLERTSYNQKILTSKYGDDKIILKYRTLVDDSGRVDTGTFAMTKGKTITLNKFMYDDSTYLVNGYNADVASGHFTKGTTYKNIIDHEFGHIFARKDKSIIQKLRRIIHSRSLSMDMTDSGYVVKYISKYAGVGMDYDVIESYQELMPELNAMLNGQNRKFAEEILKEAGII